MWVRVAGNRLTTQTGLLGMYLYAQEQELTTVVVDWTEVI
jgi:hypothetical protein